MNHTLHVSVSVLASGVNTVLFLLLVMLAPLSASPLKAYQWKNRVLLVEANETENAVRALLIKRAVELEERDFIVINLSPGKSALPLERTLSDEERETLRKLSRVKVNQTTFILLGKDGGEKARQRDTLNLEKLFSLIDTMPMRKAEMKQKKK